MRLFRRLFLVSALGSALLPAQLVISQVYGGGGNSGATLRNDFVEIFNPTANAVSVTGWSVQYASSAGTTWQVTSLTGSVQPGRYFLVQQAQGTGGTVNLPTPDATGSIAMSATSGKVALVSSTTALTGTGQLTAPVVDFVGYGTANFSEGSAAAPALTNTTAALRAADGCTDTNVNSADFASGAPNPRNSASPQNTCSGPPPLPPPFYTISQIQGNASASALAGQKVETRGVVTGVKSNGYFIQTPDAQVDADPATSEGIFVFTAGAPPTAAAVGNGVTVIGTVAEFIPSADPAQRPITELTGPVTTLLNSGNPLPAPVMLTTANLTSGGGIEQLERFEGMRVTVPSLTVVAPTDGAVDENDAVASSRGVFYGVVTGLARPFREPGVDVYETLPASSPCCVPRFDANPELIRVDSDAIGAPALNVATGAVIANLTGPLDYSFRAYTILADGAQTVLSPGLTAALPVPAPTAGEATVASFNLQRFYDAADDPGGDVVMTALAFDNRLAKASLAIRNVLRLPDILVVEEVENLAALQAIANRVNSDAGASSPNYQAFLAEGNDVGLIDIGILVKGNCTVLEVQQIGKTATYIDPNTGNPETLHDRPPYLVRVSVAKPGLAVPVEISVLGNHFRSLNGINSLTDGARVRAKRLAQAEFVAQWIHGRQAINPNESILTIGDFNAFEFSDGYVHVMGSVAGTPPPATTVVLPATGDLLTPDLTNLTTLLPAADRYSYVFSGSAQTLDHVLANPALMSRFSRIHVARANADFPETARNDATRPERLSDHDMPVAYFRSASNITAGLEIDAQSVVFVPGRNVWRSTLRVKNRNGANVPGTVSVLITGLPAGVTLIGAAGQTGPGPYLRLADGLKANATEVLILEFANPAGTPFTYGVSVFQGEL